MNKEDKELTGPEEVEFDSELAKSAVDLSTLMNNKAKDKASKIPNLQLLKKSQFYMNGENLREHIGTYKDYAILIKQEKIKSNIKDDQSKVEMFPSLVELKDLKKMKKVNGNIIRKTQPDGLHDFEKMPMILEVIRIIDEL